RSLGLDCNRGLPLPIAMGSQVYTLWRKTAERMGINRGMHDKKLRLEQSTDRLLVQEVTRDRETARTRCRTCARDWGHGLCYIPDRTSDGAHVRPADVSRRAEE